MFTEPVDGWLSGGPHETELVKWTPSQRWAPAQHNTVPPAKPMHVRDSVGYGIWGLKSPKMEL